MPNSPGVRAPVTRTIRVHDVALTYYEWRAPPGYDDPPLLIAHATGFHARCYDAIVEHFPDRRVIALDMRGHGRSDGGPIDDWRVMAHDVTAFMQQLRLRRTVGIGHSMGAHVLLQSAADEPQLFGRLILFDPVILAPPFYKADGPLYTADAPHPAIRRKREFPSPQAMKERFATREPYSLFTPRVFDDYCEYGLIKQDGGGYELACAPDMEASVYASSRSNRSILDAARRLSVPALIVRAKQTEERDFKGSPTWPGLAETIAQGTDLYRPDRTHFHPFEDPDDAAQIIADALAS